MSNHNEPVNPNDKEENQSQHKQFYPIGEDIYNRAKKEADIDPENTDSLKTTNEKEANEQENEKDFEEDETGADLDIPGAELDDENEAIGSEDEENNYYSVGGDNHNDLEEEKGE